MKLLNSRRFISAVLAIVAIIAVDQFGLAPEKVSQVIDAITQIVSVLIAGFAGQDIAKAIKQ